RASPIEAANMALRAPGRLPSGNKSAIFGLVWKLRTRTSIASLHWAKSSLRIIVCVCNIVHASVCYLYTVCLSRGLYALSQEIIAANASLTRTGADKTSIALLYEYTIYCYLYS